MDFVQVKHEAQQHITFKAQTQMRISASGAPPNF